MAEKYEVRRDGRLFFGPATWNDAFAWLLGHQGQSVHHATTHEGWEILAVPSLAERLAKLPPLGSTDGKRGDLPAIKVFTPDANATLVLWEYDPDEMMAFGWCDLGLGFPELGYVSVEELIALRGALGLPVEIDKHGADTRFKGIESVGGEVPTFLLEGANAE